jgi:hypothetical protein
MARPVAPVVARPFAANAVPWSDLKCRQQPRPARCDRFGEIFPSFARHNYSDNIT